MPETGNTYSVLFLCSDNYEQILFAQLLFNHEAKKMELTWHASSRIISLSDMVDSTVLLTSATTEALKELGLSDNLDVLHCLLNVTDDDSACADLLVVLSQPEQRSLIQERCSAWTKQIEVWDIKLGQEMLASIQSEIKNLIVRLILKSGKRQGIQKENICSNCRQSSKTCFCPKKSALSQQKQRSSQESSAIQKHAEVIRVSLEKKGRRGKLVTIVSGFLLGPAALEKLAASLKKLCGSGGTVKEEQIEIQGDHRDRLITELTAMGYKSKRIGS